MSDTRGALAGGAGRALNLIHIFGGPLDRGGAELQLAALVRRQVDRGHKVTVLCLARPGVLAEPIRASGANVQALCDTRRGAFFCSTRAGRLLFGLVWLVRCVRRLSPDLVQCTLPHAQLVGGLAAFWLPHIAWVVSHRTVESSLRMSVLTKALIWLGKGKWSAHVGNSRAVTHDLVRCGVPSDKLALIYNGVNIPHRASAKDRAQFRHDLSMPQAGLVLAMVGNLWPYKGHGSLIRALARAKLGRAWRLLIVGADRGQHEPLQALTASLGLERNVVFYGVSEEVAKILAIADIGVSASHREGFPNAVLEYMAAGLGIVATDVGGTREALGDAGLLVPAQDDRSMAAAIMRLADPEVCARYGALARQRAGRFDGDRCADEYELLYQSVVQTNKLPAELQTRSIQELASPK